MAGSDGGGLVEWHRLFGMLLKDYFKGTPFEVEYERDLSHQQQFLDVVILRKGKGRFPGRLPDGLADLADHNLITFKSHRDTLDGWAMNELIGHYVSYRKLTSPSVDDLLPAGQFRLYAVCARHPDNLAQQVPWREVQAGVYDCSWGTECIRVVVAGRLPREGQNAPLHLFAANAELAEYGRGHYQRRSADTSTLLGLLFGQYQGEGVAMPETLDDVMRRATMKFFKEQLTAEEKQKAYLSLPANERRELMQGLPAAERRELVQGLPAAERRELVQGLPAAERRELVQSLALDDLLDSLTPEQIEAIRRLPTPEPAAPAKPRKRRKR